MTATFKQAVEQVAKDKQKLERDRRKFDEEKEKWEEEKARINNSFIFHGQRIVLEVGGTHYSTSLSTLTKYPESMLGVMFSGRHDLEPMKCSDGSFFLDRDGTYFRHILNYLRDGEEAVESFPKSTEVLQEILREATYYQLEGLVTAINPIIREVNVISQNDMAVHFKPGSGNFVSSYIKGECGSFINLSQHSAHVISYTNKNIRGLSFNAIKFVYPVSFIGCDLSFTAFTCCCFESNVTFEDCVLDDTIFSNVGGLVTNSHASFTGSKTDKTKFDPDLRRALRSARKIN